MWSQRKSEPLCGRHTTPLGQKLWRRRVVFEVSRAKAPKAKRQDLGVLPPRILLRDVVIAPFFGARKAARLRRGLLASERSFYGHLFSHCLRPELRNHEPLFEISFIFYSHASVLIPKCGRGGS